MSIKRIVRQISGKSDFGEHRDVVVADIWSCKFSCDGEGRQRGARASIASNPLILPSDFRFTCPPYRSDHRKIYRRKYHVVNAVFFRVLRRGSGRSAKYGRGSSKRGNIRVSIVGVPSPYPVPPVVVNPLHSAIALSIPAACLSPEGSFRYMMFFYDF